MVGGQVCRKTAKLTKDESKALCAVGVARSVAQHGKQRVALEGGCDPKTVERIMAGQTEPELHTALNIVSFDPSAGYELLEKYGLGLHVIDVDTVPDGQAMAALAEFLAAYAAALADGRRNHIETCQLAALIAQLLPWMHGICAQAQRIKSAA